MPLSHTVRHHKDWQIEQSAFVAALTFNKSGSLFGLLCGKTCSYYVGAPTSCERGSVYPGLMTAPGGAIALTLRCVHVREEGVEEEFMLIDEDLTEAFGEEGEIAIAVPMEGGQFNVSRFSLAGAVAARRDMLEIAEK